MFCFKLPSVLAKEQEILCLLNQRICVAGQMEYLEIHGKFPVTCLEEKMDEVKSMIYMWQGRYAEKFMLNDPSVVCETGYLFLRTANLRFESDQKF